MTRRAARVNVLMAATFRDAVAHVHAHPEYADWHVITPRTLDNVRGIRVDRGTSTPALREDRAALMRVREALEPCLL